MTKERTVVVKGKVPESSRPKRSILTDETYTLLRAMIFSHEIAPGEKVNIDALTLRLGVSQTPIREALARLESEDLIAKEALKGYRATNLLSVKEFADLFNFRLLIEPWAAEQAAIYINEKGINELLNELNAAKEAIKLDDDQLMEAITMHDERFHSLIAQYSGNKSVKSAFQRTHCHLHLFRLYVATQKKLVQPDDKVEFIQDLFSRYYQSDRGQLAIKQHSAIFKAIATKNPQKAKDEMFSHIETSLKRFTSDLKIVHTGTEGQ